MKLDTAIELGPAMVKSLKRAKFHDHADAITLLIEAGKRIQLRRIESHGVLGPLLPGETEDGSPP